MGVGWKAFQSKKGSRTEFLGDSAWSQKLRQRASSPPRYPCKADQVGPCAAEPPQQAPGVSSEEACGKGFVFLKGPKWVAPSPRSLCPGSDPDPRQT